MDNRSTYHLHSITTLKSTEITTSYQRNINTQSDLHISLVNQNLTHTVFVSAGDTLSIELNSIRMSYYNAHVRDATDH